MAKINFVAVSRVSDGEIAHNQAVNNRAGHPPLGASPVPLAVVGGAPSVRDSLSELKDWNGEVWAINGAIQWCLEHGINASLYMIDPAPMDVWPDGLFDGVEKAILADFVNPGAFELIPDIEMASLGKDKILHSTTAASTVPMIAAKRGHPKVRLFGCNGSFDRETHAYKDERSHSEQVWVRCGEEYLTTPQFIMQTEFLAGVTRGVPEYLSVAGEGFLPALIEQGDYEVTHVSKGIHDKLEGGHDMRGNNGGAYLSIPGYRW